MKELLRSSRKCTWKKSEGSRGTVELRPPPPQELVERLASEIDLPRSAIELLVSRGYQTRDEVISFLKPEFSHLHDPFLMTDMEKSVDRLISAVDSGELITLWGDYDVDGVTGIALLYRALKSLGGRLRFHIPHRVNDGYGLSENGVIDACEAGSTLMVTVDCGIAAQKEIELGANRGMDTIVTDHHLQSTSLPPAFAILDPKCEASCGLEAEHYPFRELAGVGVAFKLVQALWEKKKFPAETLEEELDLVALGTIADCVPLVGENRVFSRIGIKKLNQTRKCGLRALLKSNRLLDKRIDSRDVAFILAPRLNAPGRMAQARKAVELLLSEDELRAIELSGELDGHNSERKRVEDRILSEAISMVEEDDLEKNPILVLAKDGWHPGVIGICASRIAEKYCRPTILIGLDGDEGKGSARSVPSLHIHEALSKCKEYLEDFGGHSQAAGMRINRKKIDGFREKLKEVVSEKVTEEDLIPRTVADLGLSFDQIDEKLLKLLRLFAPYGFSNPVPLFLTQGVEAVGTPRLVGREHLKVKVRHESRVFSAIGFGLGEFLRKIEIAKPELGIVYSIGEDNFTGTKKTVLYMKRLWSRESCGAEGFCG